jgi:hypothetical protein
VMFVQAGGSEIGWRSYFWRMRRNAPIVREKSK